ncbi:heavy metal translocating P-type ATPase [Actinomycetospora lemnae]|uniref:Heavy metal translocating P-type ATPase n=1 Tax=Actinomycetospora lemnae TaxID=3019891 RepID=A0ABT5T123_9PSEU|nr:heavy metal translocating P-type ATPase [Actinomycetospora sp. DW7H6]MDD7968086.1 heavy metal translocating P-type ATPase [Actinomycetospora sp. DW7H6]
MLPPETIDETAPASARGRTVPRPPGPLRTLAGLPEARWAGTSVLLFALAVPAQLLGAPSWVWGPLYAGCYVTGGWGPAWSGLQALRERTLDVDLLMIVAALGAAAIGQVLDGGLLVVIFATSGALEAWATARTESSVRGLLELAPDRATRLDPVTGDEERVAADELAVDDLVLVRPGEMVGADAVVLDGTSEVDQATITGEPLPAAKAPGDEVFAGTLNGTGALRVRVARGAGDSVVARIAELVEQASATKARTQRWIEQIEQRYSLGVVVATLLVFGVPVLLGEPLADALLRAMTFMIVASPCAVVLSTMPPLLAAIATAGRHGVLVKSAEVMEQLGTITAVALDKTGTLTRGRPVLTAVHAVAGSWDADTALATAAAAEHPSEHPLARAVVAAARDRRLPLPPASGFTARPGHGVSATVARRTIEVGRPGEDAPGQVREIEDSGGTAVVVHADGAPVAVLAVHDALRPAAADSVAALAARTATPPTLLTGDNPRAAQRTADAVGITDVHAGLLPADKVDAVERRRADGDRLLVVGDGVNDAPALAAADVGAAMGRAGADLTLTAADVVVVRDDLTTLPALLDLARRTRRVVIANLVIAASIIGVLVVWDLVGHLPLPLGVAGHEGSTILVALNGLRLLRSSAWTRPPAPTRRCVAT